MRVSLMINNVASINLTGKFTPAIDYLMWPIEDNFLYTMDTTFNDFHSDMST